MMHTRTAYIILLVLLLSLAGFAQAAHVGVEISTAVLADFKKVGIEDTNNIVTLYLGIRNTGSIGYDARTRMDIISSGNILFTGWSERKEIAPGERESFVIYAYKPDARNISVRLRAYYGNEIKELDRFNTSDGNTSSTEDVFSITNFRTYDRYMRFDLRSNQTIENVLILPQDGTGTWIFEQKRIEKMGKNSIKEVVLPYSTGFFYGKKIPIIITTENGKYYHTQEFQLHREGGIMKYVHLAMDLLGGIFRS